MLGALNVQVSTGVPYTHTFNPLYERQNCVVETNLRILMKLERTNVQLGANVAMGGNKYELRKKFVYKVRTP